MIHINKDFRITDKDKKIIWSILGSFFAVNVILLIVTSGYNNDIAISVFFRRGMANNFIRGIARFVIADGFNSLLTYSIPLALLILESLYVYVKKRKTVISNITYKIVFIIASLAIFAIFEYFIVRNIPYFYGWGKSDGFNSRRLPYFVYSAILSGGEFYSIYVVSIILNNLIEIGLFSYIHFVLAKRRDFIEEQYGLKAVQGFIYIGFLYAVYNGLSVAMNRPHPYRVKGNDYLQEIKTINNGKYEKYYNIYIHQGGFNYGGTVKGGSTNSVDGIYNNQLSFPEEGPGGRNAHDQLKNFGQDNDFPSGHVDEMCLSLNTIMIIFGSEKQSKKQKTLKFSGFSLMILGGVGMVFGMLIGQGHGMSDMAFSFVGALPAYFLSGLAANVIFKLLPKSKPFKEFGFETGCYIVYGLLLIAIVATAGFAVGTKFGNDALEVGLCQFGFGLIALLISVFAIIAAVANKNSSLKFILMTCDSIVLLLASLVGALAANDFEIQTLNVIEIVVLGLTSCSLIHVVTHLTFNIVKIKKENLNKHK